MATESVPGITGSVPGRPEGSGGPPSGATSPVGLHGPSVGGDQPQVGWCAPHQGPRRPKRGRGQTLGQMGPKAHPRCASPSPPCGRHPDGIWGAVATPREGTLGGGAAPPLPLYILEVLEAARHTSSSPSWRSPTPLPPRLLRCLAKPCWSTTLLPAADGVLRQTI